MTLSKLSAYLVHGAPERGFQQRQQQLEELLAILQERSCFSARAIAAWYLQSGMQAAWCSHSGSKCMQDP
jgi:hypothetical protein